MKTLELYNAVESKSGGEYKILPEFGIIVAPDASYAIKEIKAFYEKKNLSGAQLNSTFHKSWQKVKSSTREELYIEQIRHYASTYGTGFTSNWVYIPDETLEVPSVEVNFLVVRGLTKKEIIERSLKMFESGVALTSETILSILEVLAEFGYEFTNTDNIKNKEVQMIICRQLGIVPSKPEEYVRYLIYLATSKTLLIKNKSTYKLIESIDRQQKLDITNALNKADIEKLASVFNRFKPIFLSFKKVLGPNQKKLINSISKLSKTLHKPMSYNILNDIGGCSLVDLESERKNLLNANFFQLARCLQYLQQDYFSDCKVYSIRNGKAWTKQRITQPKNSISKINFLLGIIKEKYDLTGKKIYIPEGVQYALPTSEKQYVGNIPMGTKLSAKKSLALGVYWHNDGGARDIDVSAVSSTKVGWNSMYDNKGVTYSGDMTNASSGAVEYIRVDNTSNDPQIVFANIFNGLDKGSKFKICIGKGNDISRNYMMDPNNVWFSADTESLAKQTIVGFIIPSDEEVSAIVLNLTFGSSQVSGSTPRNIVLRNALYQKWTNCFYLNDLVKGCGATLVTDSTDADFDLTPSKLEKDTILSIFE